MKILVFSDSHGRGLGMYDAIEREQPDAVIHLGDYAEDAEDLMRSYPMLPIYHVRGNNDFGSRAPLKAVITPQNIPMYITHGHKEHVSWLSYGIIPQCARENGCGFAFFGHTHCMMLEEDSGVTICNPGSISLPRGGPASYARLTLEDGRMQKIELLKENGGLLRQKKFK